MRVETQTRSIAKSISWRIFGTIATAALVFAFTGKWVVALTVGGIEALSKIALFYVHERVWHRIRFGVKEIEPCVIWLTGLSGSGKSTIAKALQEKLKAQGYRVERLDGDEIRDLLPSTGFSREARENHILRVGLLARYLERNGVFVICSLISPYESSRSKVRSLCNRFVEIHVSTPLEECERRDVKGLYARARRGEIPEFTGISSPYEAPASPELVLDTSRVAIHAGVDSIIGLIR